MNRAVALLATIPLATSAHAAERAVIPQEFIQRNQSIVYKSEIGQVGSAEVGEAIYQEKLRTVSKRFRIVLKSDVSTPINEKYTLSAKAGAGGPMLKRAGYPAAFLCMPATGPGFLGIGTKVVSGCLTDSTGSGSFDRAAFAHTTAVYPLATPIPYGVETTETVTEHDEKFHIHVLYQGLSKGEVKIAYREFIDGLARPAFDQDISYELNPDGTGTIGLKGMRIKVLKATGHSITYVLEQPMPPQVDRPFDRARDRDPKKPWYQ